MRINLLVIATNQYVRFLEGLLDSAHAHFLPGHEISFSAFTDRIEDAQAILAGKPYFSKISFFPVEHRPFPYPTLYRFHFFQRYKKELEGAADHYFYLDADCLIKKPITSESVLSERTAVQHCGYVGERGTYEVNRRSTSYVGNDEGQTYYGGGFWGFSRAEFWKFIDVAVQMIDADAARGVVPVWHDESVLNRYLINHPPEKVLSPAYHWPENRPHIWQKWKNKGVNYECIVLLLDKNHAELRKSAASALSLPRPARFLRTLRHRLASLAFRRAA